MGFTKYRVEITYYVSFSVVLCLWLWGSNGVNSSFKIFRGEQDIFTNMECNRESETNCNKDQCNSYGAECVAANLCQFCRCTAGNNTFMMNQSRGACKSDDKIIPESGCYRFSHDGSFMKYLNYNETKLELSISAPIFKENNGNCRVQNTFKFTQNGQKWEKSKALGSFFNIIRVNGDTKKLKIESMENLRRFNGSLLNLTVSCEKRKSETKETYCVLLKLQSLPPYSVEINRIPSPSPTITSTEKVKTKITTEETTKVTTEETTVSSVHSPTSLTSPSQKVSARKETSESGGTNVAAIAVPVTLLLLALALVIGYLVYYRRRKKRAQRQQEKNAAIGMVNCSKDIYEEPDRIYETLKDDGLSPNEPGTSSDIYSYPDSNPTVPASTQQEYTYADDRDFSSSNLSTKQAAKEATNNGAVYETLEQPTNNFYNYPDNTNIANKGSPELAYTYAKDTDLPRSTADRKTAPKRNSEPDTGNALYHTLQEEGTTPTEQEYSYAKNTDMPFIPLSAQQRNNEHSSRPSSSSALYPPQLPVYSTLEEPDDVENPQVTEETPNSGDHTYIDVIEGSNSTNPRNTDNASGTA